MPAAVWSDKRQRQYEDIEKDLESRGKSKAIAEEIAARTVNKERAQHGEAKTASRASTGDLPAPRRGGLRSHQSQGGRTLKQLRAEAGKAKVPGRSTMSKAELERALQRDK